ncbi:zinc finger protein 84-like isoform X3 [Labrus mixtus]|uniref:zinc finger protein 84-like isoform X3 n=1 Tax=Labrus mixtus TaxID=508554 RepID=UPI0029C0BBA8|nr:zinc finger protein 84-like isoform X3 [Labrus mixtus]
MWIRRGAPPTQEKMDVILTPEIKLQRAADIQQLMMSKGDLSPEQQDWSFLLEDTKPPHIKEEQEDLWISQEGEQLQGLKEADTTMFPFTPVSVKSEDEEKPQSSQLHQRQTEQMETGVDGEDCGGAEPERHLQPEIEVKIEDSSEPETPDSDDDWKETTEHQSGLNSVKNIISKRLKTNKKSHCCSECGKMFNNKRNLCRHLRIHTGEKPFSCSVCGKRFNQKGNLTSHMLVHTGEKPFSCSVCGKTFKQKATLTKHVRIHTEEKPFSCSVCT